ncbi:MAG: hypothetical protein ACRYFX_23140 [Janthinobacterium lividum]
MTTAANTPRPEANFLELRYRPDLHLLVSRWQRPVSAAEFRQGYCATLGLAQAVGCPFWQVDIRSRNAPDAATRHWLTTEFLPQLPQQLAGSACLGCLLTPALLAQMGPPTNTVVQTAFFAEEGPLTTWILKCQLG